LGPSGLAIWRSKFPKEGLWKKVNLELVIQQTIARFNQNRTIAKPSYALLRAAIAIEGAEVCRQVKKIEWQKTVLLRHLAANQWRLRCAEEHDSANQRNERSHW
jgi:hypothetical protein